MNHIYLSDIDKELIVFNYWRKYKYKYDKNNKKDLNKKSFQWPSKSLEMVNKKKFSFFGIFFN